MEQPPLLPADALANVPPWARILLARVWEGTTINDARTMVGSKVSESRIQQTGALFPAWYQMLMDAAQGALDHCPVISRELTRAHAWAEEEARHKVAVSEARDRVPAMRLGAEIRQDVGQGAQASASATARVTIIMASVSGGPPVGRIIEGHATDDTHARESTTPPAPAHDEKRQP